MSGQETDKTPAGNGAQPETPNTALSDGLNENRPSESASAAAGAQNAHAPVVIRQSGGRGLAAGALVLALLAAGASGFLFVQGQNVLKMQEMAFAQKIDQAAVGESENAKILQENNRRQAELAAALAREPTASASTTPPAPIRSCCAAAPTGWWTKPKPR